MSRVLLLAAGLSLVAGCFGGSNDAGGAGPSESDPVHESLPPVELEPGTDRQRELRDAAWAAVDRGDFDTGVTALLALARTDPMSQEKASGMLLLAEYYSVEGRHAEALDLLLRLRADAPASAELEYVLARTYLDIGDDEEAEGAFRRATRVDADYLRAYVALAALLRRHDRARDADTVMLRLERQSRVIGERLATMPDASARTALIRRLDIGLPHPSAARAASLGLVDEDPEVVRAALETLATIGTVDVIPRLEPLTAPGADDELSTLARIALEAIRARAAAADTLAPD